jgi:coniferyl-aldehyde dehydrogenase
VHYQIQSSDYIAGSRRAHAQCFLAPRDDSRDSQHLICFQGVQPHLPIMLLGGKSPVLVGRSADIAEVAKRVMTAKTFNAGQICLAPDYVLLPKECEDRFIAEATTAMKQMYGSLKDSPDYTSIISQRHFGRLSGWVEDARKKGARIIELNPGNEDFSDPTLHRLPPYLILDVSPDLTVMQEEIFGPLLPIKTYEKMDEQLLMSSNTLVL